MYEELINFFKTIELYNEDYFNKIKVNTKTIDLPYEEIKDFVGCYKKDNEEFKLILPKLTDYYSMLIYIHEYTHCLFLDDEEEIFPNLMEAIFINKYIKDRKTIIEKTKEEILKSTSEKHLIGKKVKLKAIEKYTK